MIKLNNDLVNIIKSYLLISREQVERNRKLILAILAETKYYDPLIVKMMNRKSYYCSICDSIMLDNISFSELKYFNNVFKYKQMSNLICWCCHDVYYKKYKVLKKLKR